MPKRLGDDTAGKAVELFDEVLSGDRVVRVPFGIVDSDLVSLAGECLDRHDCRPLVGVDLVEFRISFELHGRHELPNGPIPDPLLVKVVQPDAVLEQSSGDAIRDTELRRIRTGRFHLF